jgi:FdrA protein
MRPAAVKLLRRLHRKVLPSRGSKEARGFVFSRRRAKVAGLGPQPMSDPTRDPAPAPASAAPLDRLLAGPVRVVNIGLEQFATDLAGNGAAVVQIEWAPPAAGDAKLGALLAKLGG